MISGLAAMDLADPVLEAMLCTVATQNTTLATGPEPGQGGRGLYTWPEAHTRSCG